uniref:Uncharacterized protein n=1 Tax=Glossina austeni TaxID=7395 RepID=A0A1A9VII5_GLOAU
MRRRSPALQRHTFYLLIGGSCEQLVLAGEKDRSLYGNHTIVQLTPFTDPSMTSLSRAFSAMGPHVRRPFNLFRHFNRHVVRNSEASNAFSLATEPEATDHCCGATTS